MIKIEEQKFLEEVLTGLQVAEKSLPSKYFYDKTGDALFQRIMELPEYYPTRCETEILKTQAPTISDLMQQDSNGFDLIELGAGDATKSKLLLRDFLERGLQFAYMPVDISANVIATLQDSLPKEFSGLKIRGLQGDYFEMLSTVGRQSKRRKLVLFLGGNIGNYTEEEAVGFLKHLQEQLAPGDLLLTGFDLKKHPLTILNAYNDKAGITSAFNMNLLHRMNRELSADFIIENFEHFPTYDPQTGACKSFLISLKQQTVTIGGRHQIEFEANEPVFTEISQKYAKAQITNMAGKTGFKEVCQLTDAKGWFVDAVWEAL